MYKYMHSSTKFNLKTINHKPTKNLNKTSTVITTNMVDAFVEMHIGFLLLEWESIGRLYIL